MNAVDYVKQNGIEKARIHLDRMKAERWINSFFNDLKQIVDAFDLVESKGGLRLAHIFMQSDKFKSYSWHGKIHFEKAVNLVEQCQ